MHTPRIFSRWCRRLSSAAGAAFAGPAGRRVLPGVRRCCLHGELWHGAEPPVAGAVEACGESRDCCVPLPMCSLFDAVPSSAVNNAKNAVRDLDL